jgi:hypothetical protein
MSGHPWINFYKTCSGRSHTRPVRFSEPNTKRGDLTYKAAIPRARPRYLPVPQQGPWPHHRCDASGAFRRCTARPLRRYMAVQRPSADRVEVIFARPFPQEVTHTQASATRAAVESQPPATTLDLDLPRQRAWPRPAASNTSWLRWQALALPFQWLGAPGVARHGIFLRFGTAREKVNGH